MHSLSRLNPAWGAFGVVLAFLLSPVQAGEFDWPQWRGPDRSDVSRETGLLKAWPEGGPKRLWIYRQAGNGYSGPAVAGGKLFTMGARSGTEYLIVLDAGTGEELWTAEIAPAYRNNWGDGPRGTPAVDGDRVYALGAQGTLVCANVSDGKVLWRVTMESLGGSTPGWGYAESVLVDGDRVLCTPGGSKGAIAALDKATGKTLWQSKEFTDGAQYASMVASDHNGTRQYIQLTMKSIVGVRAEDGKVLWTSPWPGRTAVIPTPIFKDGHVYVTAGYGAGCKLIKIGAGNEVTEVYANKVMKNHHGGVILVDGHVYGHMDPGWGCQNFKTGEEVWRDRKPLGKGAIAYADDRFYCLEENSGTVALIEVSTEGWKEHGRFKLEPQSEIRSGSGAIWTHPVISNGKLYLRDQDLIYCYDVAEK